MVRLPQGTWLSSAIVVILVLAGYALAMVASGAPQCCDAMAYQDEARSIVAGAPQILWVHNYAYAAFLALLQVVGLGDRVGLMFVQTTLLYVAVFAAALAISRSTHASIPVAMLPLAAVALVPASAWSGYTLSEGLAAPVLLLVFGLVVSVTFRVMSAGWQLDRTTTALAFALGLLSGVAWMVRPALVWIPVVTGMIVIGLCVSVAWRRNLRALAIPFVMAAATLVAMAPQLTLSDPLKLDLARGQAGGGSVNFRYATDVTSCGSPMLVFSPLTEEGVDLSTAVTLAPDNTQWRVTAAVAHVISGRDARPSPTYIDSYADRKWLVLSASSGFAVMGFVTAAANPAATAQDAGPAAHSHRGRPCPSVPRQSSRARHDLDRVPLQPGGLVTGGLLPRRGLRASVVDEGAGRALRALGACRQRHRAHHRPDDAHVLGYLAPLRGVDPVTP